MYKKNYNFWNRLVYLQAQFQLGGWINLKSPPKPMN